MKDADANRLLDMYTGTLPSASKTYSPQVMLRVIDQYFDSTDIGWFLLHYDRQSKDVCNAFINYANTHIAELCDAVEQVNRIPTPVYAMCLDNMSLEQAKKRGSIFSIRILRLFARKMRGVPSLATSTHNTSSNNLNSMSGFQAITDFPLANLGSIQKGASLLLPPEFHFIPLPLILRIFIFRDFSHRINGNYTLLPDAASPM